MANQTSSNAKKRYYVKIGSLKGECTIKDLEEYNQIFGYNSEVSQSVTRRTGDAGNIAPGGSELHEISFWMTPNKSYPLLKKACSKGEHIDEIIFKALRSTGESGPQCYMEVRFNKNLITRVAHVSEADDSDELITQKVSIVCHGSVNWIYHETDRTGLKVSTTETGYDWEHDLPV